MNSVNETGLFRMKFVWKRINEKFRRNWEWQ